jgi:metal-responsive CopG/Arc/MetJ family transcriptional regulator
MEDTIDSEKMATLQIRIPHDLLRRVDNYRFKLVIRPTRSQTVRFLVESALQLFEENSKDAPDGT